jgi:hypothetical protein
MEDIYRLVSQLAHPCVPSQVNKQKLTRAHPQPARLVFLDQWTLRSRREDEGLYCVFVPICFWNCIVSADEFIFWRRSKAASMLWYQTQPVRTQTLPMICFFPTRMEKEEIYSIVVASWFWRLTGPEHFWTSNPYHSQPPTHFNMKDIFFSHSICKVFLPTCLFIK